MTEHKKGLFITVEGIEGAGKSTVMRFMEKYLREFNNIKCLITREFGGTEIAELIRKVLLNYQYQERMCEDTEILLAFASRAQHLTNLILPNLERCVWVLCDRFTDSTYAYQGFGRGISIERIAILEQWVQRDLRPDYTFLLDIDVKLGMERMQSRKNVLDRIESEEIQFFQKVRNGYLKLAEQEPNRYRVIDAAKGQDEVLIQIEKYLAEILIKINV